jgi:pSer/pThr/pTyr-binding forkhead associated (FHA) protein
MERPSRLAATAREIILEIVRNMREGLEPLHYSTLPPSIYQVYLHPDDLDRLRGIGPRIVEEARRALDAELESLNRASLGERLKIARRDLPKVSAPEGGWQIGIHENTDDDTEPGDIVVNSELALPAKTEFGAGSMTKRIATRRLAGAAADSETAARTSYQPAAASAPTNEAEAFAVIEYEDNGGRKTFSITKDQVVVGRGGRDYWTDLKLDTLPDVSREHFRLRRDPESGRFFLKDLSRLGTTIDGQPVPSSIEVVEGEKRDRNLETPVPDRARIGLADVLFLEFRNAAAPPRES